MAILMQCKQPTEDRTVVKRATRPRAASAHHAAGTRSSGARACVVPRRRIYRSAAAAAAQARAYRESRVPRVPRTESPVYIAPPGEVASRCAAGTPQQVAAGGICMLTRLHIARLDKCVRHLINACAVTTYMLWYIGRSHTDPVQIFEFSSCNTQRIFKGNLYVNLYEFVGQDSAGFKVLTCAFPGQAPTVSIVCVQ